MRNRTDLHHLIFLCRASCKNHKIVSCILKECKLRATRSLFVKDWLQTVSTAPTSAIGGWGIHWFTDHWPHRNIFINIILLNFQIETMFPDFGCILSNVEMWFSAVAICFRFMFRHLYDLHFNWYYYARIVKMIN